MYSVLYVMVILYYVQCTVCDGYIILCTLFSVLYVMVILYYVQCTVCDGYIMLCTVYCM